MRLINFLIFRLRKIGNAAFAFARVLYIRVYFISDTASRLSEVLITHIVFFFSPENLISDGIIDCQIFPQLIIYD